MPARHDILCGALDFLWQPWGSIELWEEPITAPLRRAGVATQLGHRPSRTCSRPAARTTTPTSPRGTTSAATRATRGRRAPTRPGSARRASGRGHDALRQLARLVPRRGRLSRARARWRRRPGGSTTTPARTTASCCSSTSSIRTSRSTRPSRTRRCTTPTGTSPHLIWPPYVDGAVAKGVLDEREARQVRASYGAKLSMIDHWFGRVLDALDRNGLWDDTAVIVCTDHGHYLGEKDIWGKPGVPIYEPLGHIPLLVAWPGRRPGACDALTTSVDLLATLRRPVRRRRRPHARTARRCVPLRRRHRVVGPRVRAVRRVGPRGAPVTDGRASTSARPAARTRRCRCGRTAGRRCRVHGVPEIRLPPPDDRAVARPHAGLDHPGDPPAVPARRPPAVLGLHRVRRQQAVRRRRRPAGTREPRRAAPTKAAFVDQLVEALRAIDAPNDQLERLGLG